jgi:transcription termination/antitermination protein NusA
VTDFQDPGTDAVVSTFTVASRGEEAFIGTLDDDRPALLPFSEVSPGLDTEPGAKVLVVALVDGRTAVVSATRPELIAALYAGVTPEIRTGDVRVVAVARAAGVRSKMAVAATVDGVDPVAACVGRAANRVTYVSRLLGGERIDVIPFHPDLAVFAANALAPAQVTDVTVSDDAVVARVPNHQMPAAVGGGGLNSHLAGELLGRPVDVIAV